MAIDWITPLTTPLNDVLSSAIDFFPNLIYALILLVIGWIVGSIVERIVKTLMLRFKVDQYLNKRGPMLRLTDIIPLIFEWGVYLIFIQEAVAKLELGFITQVVGVLYQEIPGVIFAVVISVVGYIIAEYVKKEIQKSRILYKGVMSSILFWLIIFVSFAIALKQTPIETTLMDQLILIIAGSVGLGVAIALGLGLKDTVNQVAKDQIKRTRRR
jgi:di/tricarboxylate transporter